MVSKFFVAYVLSILPFLYSTGSIDPVDYIDRPIPQGPKIESSREFRGDSDLLLVESFQLKIGGDQLLVTQHKEKNTSLEGHLLRFWVGAEEERTLAAKLNSGWEGFQRPVAFVTRGERFIYAATNPAGSGGFIQETVFWVAPDRTLHDIDFAPAAEVLEDRVRPDEVILAGGARNDFQPDGTIQFAFDIAHEGDPHCCPTAGYIRGDYKLVGRSSYNPQTKSYHPTFKLIVHSYKRLS